MMYITSNEALPPFVPLGEDSRSGLSGGVATESGACGGNEAMSEIWARRVIMKAQKMKDEARKTSGSAPSLYAGYTASTELNAAV